MPFVLLHQRNDYIRNQKDFFILEIYTDTRKKKRRERKRKHQVEIKLFEAVPVHGPACHQHSTFVYFIFHVRMVYCIPVVVPGTWYYILRTPPFRTRLFQLGDDDVLGNRENKGETPSDGSIYQSISTRSFQSSDRFRCVCTPSFGENLLEKSKNRSTRGVLSYHPVCYTAVCYLKYA